MYRINKLQTAAEVLKLSMLTRSRTENNQQPCARFFFLGHSYCPGQIVIPRIGGFTRSGHSIEGPFLETGTPKTTTTNNPSEVSTRSFFNAV